MSTTAISFPHSQPPTMLRNKRISLIKRPPLIRSSSPTLSDREVENRHPNNKNNKCKKSVRFCDNASLENVRLFYKTEMPIACRADPKCEMKNYIYRLKRPNWPKDSLIRRRTAVVRMEDVQIQKTGSSDDKNGITLLGSVQVANLAFEKQVTVRYTTDDWATYQDVPAQYQEPIAQSANTWDRFGFKIVFNKKQPHHQKLLLAVKYVVNGREFWDNNNKQNYEVDLICDVVLQSSNISNTKKQQQQLLDACPASSDEAVDDDDDDDDDDDNIFEDCIEDVDEHDKDQDKFELLHEKLPSLSMMNPSSSAIKPSSSAPVPTAITVLPTSANRSWSPPLSPTTPVDINPLWVTDAAAGTTAAPAPVSPTTPVINHSYYISPSDVKNKDTTATHYQPHFYMHTSKTRSAPVSNSSMLYNYYFYL